MCSSILDGLETYVACCIKLRVPYTSLRTGGQRLGDGDYHPGGIPWGGKWKNTWGELKPTDVYSLYVQFKTAFVLLRSIVVLSYHCWLYLTPGSTRYRIWYTREHILCTRYLIRPPTCPSFNINGMIHCSMCTKSIHAVAKNRLHVYEVYVVSRMTSKAKRTKIHR